MYLLTVRSLLLLAAAAGRISANSLFDQAENAVEMDEIGVFRVQNNGYTVEATTAVPELPDEGAVQVILRDGQLIVTVDTGKYVYSQSTRMPPDIDEKAYKLVTYQGRLTNGQTASVLKVVVPIINDLNPITKHTQSAELCYQPRWTRQQREFCLCHHFYDVDRAACFLGLSRSISDWAVESGMMYLYNIIQDSMKECVRTDRFYDCIEASAEMSVAAVTAVHEVSYSLELRNQTNSGRRETLWHAIVDAFTASSEIARFEEAAVSVANQYRAENFRKLPGSRLIKERTVRSRWVGLRLILLGGLLIVLAIEVSALGMEGLGLRKLGEVSVRRLTSHARSLFVVIRNLRYRNRVTSTLAL
mmetsp:Transcript_108/g.314  ORF Transcript_108/g.314 Transcript_108/m.314 type:complete len:360 (-) Transcript_108:85-1164(-)|eukprot:CAMPEP_0198734102 /NCGR_PEP_ID=MMETSP1475-20131203/50391_1 /TAXON_ID= ORGANISM="Unidentified sp., Strain CCMP1999" /NCGR_SAMPLE_ID=MMETSP1475 /ASSEMBLY_ACC=CAM_ASM_001111 /LENGTH=359 /DNA_ID=CAMNT_0044497509 /DNA_START=1380 /DNA_END=2459 /DNA_ORIENTATION=-